MGVATSLPSLRVVMIATVLVASRWSMSCCVVASVMVRSTPGWPRSFLSAREAPREMRGVTGDPAADEDAEGDREHRDRRGDDRLHPVAVGRARLAHTDESQRTRHEQPEH